MIKTRKQAAWLISAVVVAVAGGCAGCPVKPDSSPAGTGPSGTTSGGVLVSGILPIGCTDPDSNCEVDSTETTTTTGECTTGDCKPGGLNGQGIYNAEASNYCFLYRGVPMFCPEAFVNVPGGGVTLEARTLDAPTVIQKANVIGYVQDGSAWKSVLVRAITSDKTQFSISYATSDKPGETHVLTGADVQKLRLTVGPLLTTAGAPTRYDLQVIPIDSGKTATDKLQRYRVQYRESGGTWLYHCEDTAKQQQRLQQSPQQQAAPGDEAVASFLGQKRISGLSALVTTPNDDNATTMGCEKGAIVTCLSWGYTPWASETGSQQRSEYVFGSCLQAKRAAYFVRFGNYKSYTENGTVIQLRDQYGIHATSIDYLEAIWSPLGAECLNVENVRRDEKRQEIYDLNQLQAGGKGYNVPPCAQPPQWSLKGKLATGPKAAPGAFKP